MKKKFCLADGQCNEKEFILRFGNEKEKRRTNNKDIGQLREICLDIIGRLAVNRNISSDIVFTNGSGIIYKLIGQFPN